MNVLELFAGSRSFGKVAESFGWRVFSTDVNAFEKIDHVSDILAVQRSDIPFIPDVIWASPPCTTYSIAAISHHRNGTTPTSDAARQADMILAKTLEIISWFPQAKFFIENPVGMMRKMPTMRGIEKRTVTYCSYGDTRMKPTDIWTNFAHSLFQVGWNPRSMCRNGNRDCHHEAAPRGSRTGTQGLNGAYSRSQVPEMLCREIITAIIDSRDKTYE